MAASLSVTPNPAPLGANVQVSGSGFDPKKKVQLALDGIGWTTNYFRPKSDGSFVVGIRVSTSPRTQTVTARYAKTTTAVATTTVKVEEAVTPPPPEPTNPDALPTGNLPGFTYIYGDDFNSLDQNRYWAYPSNWGDTRYKQGDTRNGGMYTGFSSMTTQNSILRVRLYRDSNNQPRSVAFVPRLTPGGEDDQLYGRYAIRFRSTVRGAGWKTAWLLWPQSNTWPRDGEIDFPEGNLNSRIAAFMHRQNATSGSDQDAFNTSATYEPWHTAVIEWTPSRCEFFLDGVSIGKATSRIPNTPMHWVIQSETALDGSTPAAEAIIEIDWLAIWRYTP